MDIFSIRNKNVQWEVKMMQKCEETNAKKK